MEFGTTIIQPFTKKIINGFPATMGIISSESSNPNYSKKSVEILLQHNGKIYVLEYYDTPNNYDTPDSQAIMKRFILSFDILQNNSSTSLSNDNTLNGNNNTTWTKFSSNWVTFEYPDKWKISYPDINQILIDSINNDTGVEVGVVVNLPDAKPMNQLVNIIDLANRVTEKLPNMTIIEPFKENRIAGDPATIGKVIDNGKSKENMIFINHDGLLYLIQTFDTSGSFTTEIQQTMNKIITSLTIS
jgi:hypothetical protein